MHTIKIINGDHIYLDGKPIKGVTYYELSRRVDEHAKLTLELWVEQAEAAPSARHNSGDVTGSVTSDTVDRGTPCPK